MPIPYSLVERKLSPDAKGHVAMVQAQRSAGLEQIADRIIEQGSPINRPDIILVLRSMVSACENLLLDGYHVALNGLIQMSPKVRGLFDGPADLFDPARHQIDVGATPGRRVRRTLRDKGLLVKVPPVRSRPNLAGFTDLSTGEVNTKITPGHIGNITGSNLKFDATRAGEGIFFVPTSERPEIQVAWVTRSRPTALSFLIPELAVGSYWLEVRARFVTGGPLRTGRLAARLRVTRDARLAFRSFPPSNGH